MYAAHFAAGMVIGSRVPQAPVGALLVGVFVPDLVWIVLATAGVEPTGREVFFDDWSHSLAMTLLWATLFAARFWRRGTAVAGAVWLAVASHFLLDAPIHPKDLALYPYSSVHLGWGLVRLGPMFYWIVQLVVVVVLAAAYVPGARRLRIPMPWIAVTCAELVALHLLNLPA
jgi:hypothetical protein